MGKSRTRLLILLGPLVLALAGLACSESKPTLTPTALTEWADYTTQTTSYRIMLRIGPRVTLEVMQAGAVMTMMDQGQAVNHHLEVHIFERNGGAEVKTTVPRVTVSHQTTKLSRGLPNVEACLLANHRLTEPHFGDNLFLVDGSYTITVAVGDETAVFEDVVVSAAG